jgi:5-(carboxyamino)imidazole ribonucleotide synthase
MLGGGQLGRYALIAARVIGYGTVVLDPDPDAPAGRVADEHLVAPYDDPDALDRLASTCAIVTTEFENPPAAALERLARDVPVAPPPAAVAVAQDRLGEKRFLSIHGHAVAPYAEVADGGGEHDVLDVGWPAILKTARLGYDGKGQRDVAGPGSLAPAWDELGRVPCALERRMPLDAEVSVVLARAAGGEVVTFDVAENHHAAGILDVSVVPARIDAPLAARARQIATEIAAELDYVGVLAVELFVSGGELLVNELAPRPHNSGHWTLDAAVTSQFEQQVRAVCGLALGATAMTSPAAAMANLLGDLWSGGEPDWAVVLDDPAARLHLYGKREPRPGRKMGHLTVLAQTPDEAAERAQALRAGLTR